MGMTSSSVVGLVVAFFLMAILFPIAMDQVVAANTTSWNSAVTTIFTVVLPILVVISAAIGFIKSESGRGKG